MQLSQLSAVVPVFNPEDGLVDLCRALCDTFGVVVVVDDGSIENTAEFSRLPESCEIARHEVNKGKGRAIKTAIGYLRERHPEVAAAVFCDGDGQHTPADTVKVALKAFETGHVTLGVRDVNRKGVPFRSRFGNVLTSFLVRLIFRFPIQDTQTGLRAIPARLFPAFQALTGERYEYEMRLFSMLKSLRESLEQVPIETIYIANNRASHFRPVADSVRVYIGLFGGTFFKFCASSFLGFLVDNFVFTAVLLGFQSQNWERRYCILFSLVVARATSATVNYLGNKLFVFKSKSSAIRSYAKYWVLVLCIAALSYVQTALISAVFDAKGFAITFIKIVIDLILFVVSYRLQKRWVFE